MTAATFEADIMKDRGVTIVDVHASATHISQAQAALLESLARGYGEVARFAALDADEAADLCRRLRIGQGEVVLFRGGAALHRMRYSDAAQTLERHFRARATDECLDGSCSLPPQC